MKAIPLGSRLCHECPYCKQTASLPAAIRHSEGICPNEHQAENQATILEILTGNLVHGNEIRNAVILYGVEAPEPIRGTVWLYKIGHTLHFLRRMKTEYPCGRLWWLLPAAPNTFEFKSRIATVEHCSLEALVHYLCRAHRAGGPARGGRAEWYRRDIWMTGLFSLLATEFPVERMMRRIRRYAPCLLS